MNIIDTSHIFAELPLLVGFTIMAIVLIYSNLVWVCRAKRLEGILRELILLNKGQQYSILAYKTIYSLLRLPPICTESQVKDIHLQMIEMLESTEISKLEWLRLKRLIAQLSYVLQLAFQSIKSRVKRKGEGEDK